MKAIDEKDAASLKALQVSAQGIEDIAKKESTQAFASIEKETVEGNARLMKDGALSRLRDVVDLGYDVMKFHYDQSQPRETALDALRSLHFQGDNYFFVVQEDLTLVAHGGDRKFEGMDFGKIKDKKTGKTFMRKWSGTQSNPANPSPSITGPNRVKARIHSRRSPAPGTLSRGGW